VPHVIKLIIISADGYLVHARRYWRQTRSRNFKWIYVHDRTSLYERGV